jgi:S-adenosylmethionine hydrolase
MHSNEILIIIVSLFCIFSFLYFYKNKQLTHVPLVLMTDFGQTDGAVSAMKGVIYSVNENSIIVDLSHNIEPFNIKEASYRLYQVMQYYPQGTIFVCVVDPGVGTERCSIVAKTKTGYFIVAPDNGIISHIAFYHEIEEVRKIDETINRIAHSEKSHTFYGRDVYAYTGARLASKIINFKEVGPLIAHFTSMKIEIPRIASDNTILGEIITLDGVFGNAWTNIPSELIKQAGIKFDDALHIRIVKDDKIVYESQIPFCKTFGMVNVDNVVGYMNSLGNIAIAINQGNFAKLYSIQAGYSILIQKK